MSTEDFWVWETPWHLMGLHEAAVRANDPDRQEKARKQARKRLLYADDDSGGAATLVAALKAQRN